MKVRFKLNGSARVEAREGDSLLSGAARPVRRHESQARLRRRGPVGALPRIQ